MTRLIPFLLLLASFAWAGAIVGKPAPAFSLKDSAGKVRSLAEFNGKYVVLEWYNKDCPFVRKHYDSGNFQSLQKTWKAKGVVWLTVISSAPGKQGYLSAAEAEALRGKVVFSEGILNDESGSTGRAFGAKTTPTMVIIDPKGLVASVGAIDDNRSSRAEDVAGALNYVSVNLEALLAGKPAPHPDTPAYGCGVKYGN
jgi:peroxiredoxin